MTFESHHVLHYLDDWSDSILPGSETFKPHNKQRRRCVPWLEKAHTYSSQAG
jgi:hypothetical protein